MAYFPDLSPYAFGHGSDPGVVHVDCSTMSILIQKGDVDVRQVQKMKLLTSRPVEVYRGKHICELCRTYTHNGVLIDPNCSWARWIDGAHATARLEFLSVGSYLPPAVEEASKSQGHRNFCSSGWLTRTKPQAPRTLNCAILRRYGPKNFPISA